MREWVGNRLIGTVDSWQLTVDNERIETASSRPRWLSGAVGKKGTTIYRFGFAIGKELGSKVYVLSLILVISGCVFACNSKQGAENSGGTKFQQYYVQGEKLYKTHCSNCHQLNGTGLGRVYPPLNTSDFMDNNYEAVICLIKNGKKGELVVNGKNYNQPMPGIPTLTDLEIAEIATYIYNTWDHKRGITEVTEVSKILDACPPVE